MCVLNIEPAGFQTFEHRFNGPPFLVIREGFLRVAEGNEDLLFVLPGLVFDDGTCQIAEFSTDTVDAIQDRTEVEFGGCLTLKLAVNAELLWGNCILAMKNRQKIRPKRPETDIKLKF